jgi:HPt (histidine-containing phosphotransfer) domain-containing protein
MTPEEDTLPAPNPGMLPDRLPGIEIGSTLAALKIDAATFAHILSGFLADNRKSAETLNTALAAGDFETLRQLAHGLKGSAANIGAHDLRAAAHMLEEASRLGTSTTMARSQLEGLVRQVDSALAQALASIQSLEAPAAEAPVEAPSEPGGPAFDALLAQFDEALERADPERIATLMAAVRRQAISAGCMDKGTLAALAEKVGRYDYDQALEILRKISQ